MFNGSIDLIQEKNKSYSFILKDNEWGKYFDLIKEFVKIDVERKDAFRIKSEKVVSLEKYLKQERTLDYQQALSLFLDVGEQLEFLNKMGKGFIELNPEDIFIIFTDNTNFSFVFMGIKPFFSVKNNILEIDKIFKKSGFISPQLKNIKQIPFESIYSQNIYYQLAMMVCNCFGSIDKKFTYTDYKQHIDCILETKLYWALLRCLDDKPEDRYYLYI